MTRLWLSLLLVALLALLGLGWAIDAWYAHSSYALDEDKTLLSYKLLGRELGQQLNQAFKQSAQLTQWAQHSKLPVEITEYSNFPVPSNLAVAFEAGEALILESKEQVSLNYFLDNCRCVFSLNYPSSDFGERNTHVKLLLTLAFYGGVVALLMLWLWPLIRRLRLLRITAQAVGRGELHLRIPKSPFGYIRAIEQEFNAMAARLENLIRDNKILSRGLSHDLRTPLARLRFGLDVLGEELSDKQHLQKIEHLNRDLLDMELLVEILLDYSKLEEVNVRPALLPVEIIALVRNLIHSSYSSEVVLLVRSPGPLPILAHAEYMAMLLHNILQNALRYGAGRVQLSIEQRGTEVVIDLDDNGPGIPENERTEVLKPFYRLPQKTAIKGHGIGLALVERITQWHRGQLSLLDSETLGGLRVSLTFPLMSSV